MQNNATDGEATEASIPQTDILAGASPLSLSEYFSRDPFHFTQQDRKAIITELRAARLRFEASDNEPKATKAAKAQPRPTISGKSLGL